MTHEVRVTCNGCKHRILKPFRGYMVVLASAVAPAPPLKPPIRVDLRPEPAVVGERHFCGLDCLRTWLRDPK